jgi:hypothetical protein
MCIHASWLNEALCTRCHLKPQPPTSLGVERSREARHVSTLPKRVIKVAPQPQVATRCIGCGNTVTPAFCYTGSVLSDLIHTMHKSSHTLPVLGVLTQVVGHASLKGNVEQHKVLGGQTIESSKPIAFRKRTKGLICTTCAACISTVEGKDGERIPLVITDPLGGYLGETARGSNEAIVRYEGDTRGDTPGSSFRPRHGAAFNTRFTQGRRGKRV